MKITVVRKTPALSSLRQRVCAVAQNSFFVCFGYLAPMDRALSYEPWKFTTIPLTDNGG